MADDEAQTKTGGTEMTGGTTGVTGQTGTTTGTGADLRKNPEQPATDPLKQPPSSENNNNNKFPTNSADVEAQQMKTGVALDYVGPKSFDCAIARRIFVQKVFGMVAVMLAIVVMMTMLPFISQNFRIFALKNWWIWIVGYIFFVITYIALSCCTSLRKTSPWNYITTCVLVFSAGWVSIGITIHSDVETVLVALVMTTVCCTATIIFAIFTKFDMTNCRSLLFLISMIMLIFFIIAITAAIAFQVQWLYTVYAGLMTLVMMAYLVYDIQMMMGGRRDEISVNDPYYAAVQIFYDIVMMFWYMVQFLQGARLRLIYNTLRYPKCLIN